MSELFIYYSVTFFLLKLTNDVIKVIKIFQIFRDNKPSFLAAL